MSSSQNPDSQSPQESQPADEPTPSAHGGKGGSHENACDTLKAEIQAKAVQYNADCAPKTCTITWT